VPAAWEAANIITDVERVRFWEAGEVAERFWAADVAAAGADREAAGVLGVVAAFRLLDVLAPLVGAAGVVADAALWGGLEAGGGGAGAGVAVTAAGELTALRRAPLPRSVTVAASGAAADREAGGGAGACAGVAMTAAGKVAAALVAALRVTRGDLAMPATVNNSMSRPPMRSSDLRLCILTTANRQHDALLFTVATLILAVSSAMSLPRCTALHAHRAPVGSSSPRELRVHA
jgi:hypothetical protein